MRLSRLKISDEDHIIEGLIDRAPKTMMLREFVMNAIESANGAPEGSRRVEIGSVIIEDTPKLRIWNTGPGLGPDELFQIGDLSASLHKTKSLDGNFGVGAKVASLASNPVGVRYRSCQRGRVHEMTLGRIGRHYGRINYATPHGDLVPVKDVTDVAKAAGEDISFDWTEVVTLGEDARQNTFRSPFGSMLRVPTNWILDTLYHRFFSLDDTFEVFVQCGETPEGEKLRFRTIEQMFRLSDTYECVRDSDGAQLHAFLDPPAQGASIDPSPWREGFGDERGFVGIVYQNEIYGTLTGSTWSSAAPSFGIPVGARWVTLLLEIPESYDLIPDLYRQFLRRRDGTPDGFSADRFAGQIARLRPAWVEQRLLGFAEQPRISKGPEREIMRLAEDLGLTIEFDEDRLTVVSALGKRWPMPEVILLNDDYEIEDRWLTDRSGEYSASTRQLFINCRFPPVTELRKALENAIEEEIGALDVRMREVVKRTAETRLYRRLLRGLLFAHKKRDLPNLWSDEHCAKLTCPEALTTIAEDLIEDLPASIIEVRSNI